MKRSLMKKTGWPTIVISLSLVTVMLCLFAVFAGLHGGAEAAGPGDNLTIVWDFIEELSGIKDSVFGQDFAVYFVGSLSGTPSYCLDFSMHAPGTSTNYSSLTLSYDKNTYKGLCALLLNGHPYYDGGLNPYVAQGYTQRAIWLWLYENGYDGMDVSSETYSKASSAGKAYFDGLMNAARSQRLPGIKVTPGSVALNLNAAGDGFTGTATVSFVDLTGNYSLVESKLAEYGIEVSGYTGNDGDVLTFTAPLEAYTELPVTVSEEFFGDEARSIAYNLFFYSPNNGSDQNMAVCFPGVETDVVKAGIEFTFYEAPPEPPPVPDPEAYFRLTKTDDGDVPIEASATFRLYEVKGSVRTLVDTINLVDGEYASGGLPLGVYELVETVAPDGYLLSETPLRFLLDIEDEVLELRFKNSIDESHPPIENAKAELVGTKAVTGISGDVGEVFTFRAEEVTSANGNKIKPGGKTGEATVTGKGDFCIEIADMTEGPHYFRIMEVAGNANGWGYSGNVLWATVFVTDNGDGSAEVEVRYSGNQTFTNVYTPPDPGSVAIGGDKVVTGSGAPNATFTFTLTQLNSANVNDVKVGGITRTVDRTGQGSFTFPAIDGLIAGTYYFRVHETAGGIGSQWSNDTTPRVVTVTVSGTGSQLTADYTYTTGGASFTNTFTPTVTGTVTPPTVTTPSPSPSPVPPSPPDEELPREEPSGGGESSDGGTPVLSPPPVEPQAPPPVEPEPEPQPVPVPPPPGNVVADGDGWLELDDNGVPLGRWEWDPVAETWIFDPFPPLGELPQTGAVKPWFLLLLPAGAALVGFGRRFVLKNKRRRVWPEF